ncbi:MAG: hypothetical protein PVF52_03375, partial [Granulosicoccaceae bacterium]
AAQGWLHPGWEQGYYPDDMPAEWQLGYYANEFRAVLVAPPADSAEVEIWLDDVDDGFGFCLDLRHVPLESQILAGLKDQLLGIFVNGSHQSAPADVAVFSESHNTDISLPNSRYSQIFDDLRGSGMRLCLYRTSADLTLAGLREDIEAVLQGVPPDASCMMVWCDEPPPVEIMRQAKIIAELLGA